MTELFPESPDPIDTDDKPLDPWLLSLVDEVTFPKTEAVPREMMWARLQRQRREPVTGAMPAQSTPSRSTSRVSIGRVWITRAVGIAAVLTMGIGVGRYVLPTSTTVNTVVATRAMQHADSIAALGLGPDALAALPYSNEPARVAMEEHLGRTVALLMTVRDDDPTYGPGADISGWARELLGTTRMLIDEPQLSDERTRRLLQDLELVLAQIIQARGSVPETQRAPSETMRETNLLPRVRAAATASRLGDDLTIGGDS